MFAFYRNHNVLDESDLIVEGIATYSPYSGSKDVLLDESDLIIEGIATRSHTILQSILSQGRK